MYILHSIPFFTLLSPFTLVNKDALDPFFFGVEGAELILREEFLSDASNRDKIKRLALLWRPERAINTSIVST